GPPTTRASRWAAGSRWPTSSAMNSPAIPSPDPVRRGRGWTCIHEQVGGAMGSAARKRRTLLAGLAVSAVVATAACGGPEAGGSGGGGIEKTIMIAQVQDQTGPIAYAGLGASEGAELAIEEIEQQNFLGEGVKIELQKLDTAGEIERASSEMNKAMGDRDVDAIIGPAATQQAAAVAPLVGRQKVPTVFTQAGGQGVVINDYTFR